MNTLHPDLRRYRAFIFDIDDTLIVTFEKIAGLFVDLTREMGYPDVTLDTMRTEVWGRTMREAYPDLFPEIDLEVFKSEVFKRLELINHEVRPGARELLDLLAADGIPMGAVTAGELKRINMAFDQMGLHHYFPGRIYGSNNLAYTKPDPRALDPLLEGFTAERISLDQVVMIGDSIHDYEPARGRDVDFFAVCTGLHSREDFLAEGLAPDRIFDSISDCLVS